MNVFRYFLKGFSPNGWRPGDNLEVIELVGVLSKGIDQGSEDTLSRIDSISRKFNEVTDIDSSVRISSICMNY
ncbi:hypothetical protein GOBAR_DD21055 [Gossypium barbadense]|nr:hypothetical protein GOBAR_DD21055 [Gossypium barbadense]